MSDYLEAWSDAVALADVYAGRSQPGIYCVALRLKLEIFADVLAAWSRLRRIVMPGDYRDFDGGVELRVPGRPYRLVLEIAR